MFSNFEGIETPNGALCDKKFANLELSF